MHIKRVQNMFSWMVIASELSHVFCCVLPTVFTLVAVLVSFGLVGAMPLWLDHLHHIMHAYELPVILFSFIALVLGWGAYHLGRRMVCHETHHCESHEAQSCDQKKDVSGRVLQIATAIFVINILIYSTLHFQKSDLDFHAEHAHGAAHHEHS